MKKIKSPDIKKPKPPKPKPIKVARGVKVKRGVEEKMRSHKGSSNAGKYKNVSPKDFAGKAGGASKFSFPINDIKRARNALARAHFAPDPEGIKRAVYRKYPELKKRKQERDSSSRTSKGKNKIKTVMSEFKEGILHSGSKKGPRVTNPKQAVAIALSESRKVEKRKK